MASPPILDDPNQSARRARARVGVAVVLLAVAIGGLALLSRQKPETPLEETPAQKQDSISSEPPSNASPPTQISSAQQEPPPPALAEPPPPPPPPPSVRAVPPASPAEPDTKAPAIRPSVTAAEPPAPGKPVERATVAPTVQKPVPAPAQPPASLPKAEPAPRSFAVQVGVFTDMENARQLQAKLAEHGIPSHTETKLQVGPFATRAEAEAAREKLKALGIGAVVVPGK